MISPYSRFLQAQERTAQSYRDAAYILIGQGDRMLDAGDIDGAAALWADALKQREIADRYFPDVAPKK